MNRLRRTGWLAALVGPLLAAAGCIKPPATAPSAGPPPEVLVSTPVTKTVADYEEFPGRLEAVSSIDIRSRVTGYLDKITFKEGQEVKADDVLFEIDPRPYQAEFDRQEATVYQSEARAKRTEETYERASQLPKGSIGVEEFANILSDRKEAAAALNVAKANRAIAALNLAFTKVRTPISGRISRRYLDPGNLVKADDTVLTTVVSLDPINAVFDLDERTTLRLQDLMRQGKIVWTPDKRLPVQMGLASETGYPREGVVDFADNRVDPDTGTWRLRAVFANPQKVLAPGLFARIQLPVGAPYAAVLVSEQALGTDQGQKFVYVVGDDGVVSYRRVKVGRLHDGLRVINDGLSKDERIIVSGLQRVRQGVKVTPKDVEMPVLKGPADAPAAPPAGKGSGQPAK